VIQIEQTISKSLIAILYFIFTMNTTNTMTTKINPEEMLPQVQKMLYSQAWKFAKTYPITFEECLSEAYFAFMKACEDYQPERGQKFSSWCYYWVWCKLKDLVMKRTKDPLEFVEINDDLLGEAPPAISPSLEIVAELSSDAQEIVALVLETPAELLGGAPATAKQLLRRVKDYLVEHCGRSKDDVDAATLEISSRLRASWAN